jgi:LysM repeat protein
LQQIAADIKKPWFKVFMKIVYYTNVFIGLLVLAVALIVLIWYLRRDHRPGGPPEFELVDETTHHLGTPPLPEPLLDGSHGVVAIDPAAVTTTPPVLTHPPMATAASTADLLDTSASIGLGAEVEEAAAPATPAAEQPAIATPVEAAEDDPETAASPEMTAASSEPPQTPMTATPSTPPVVVVHDEPAAPAAAAPESTPVMTEYIVQRKDTLWSIARQHHMTLTALCEANNIELNAVLQIGQRLRVNAMPSAPGAAATATAASAWVPYKVRAGDTYYSLARTLHCDMHMLMATNAQQELRTGQSILVPSGTP